MNTSDLACYLPLHASTTKDLCANSWTATGSPKISNGKLFLDGSSYLTCDQQWLFAGQDFSIGCKFSATSNTAGGVVCLWQMYIGSSNRFQVSIETNGKLGLWKDSNSTVNILSAGSVLDGQEHYVLAVYSSGTWFLFLDGQLVGSKVKAFDGGTYTLYLGTNYSQKRNFTGYIDEFMFFHTTALHTENFTPPTDDELFAAEVELAGYAERSYDFDTTAQIDNVPILNSATKVWLTADNYPTEDIAGNLWHAYGSPTSNGSLQLSTVNQWLAKDGGITLGGKDFTIRGKFNVNSTSGSYAVVFNIFQKVQSNNPMLNLSRNNNSTTQMRFICMGSTTTFNCSHGTEHDFEVSYVFADKIFRCFVDGNLVATKTNYTLNQTSFANCWLGKSNYAADGSFIGSIDEFQIIDGVALHTQDFIPMTVAEIDALKSDFNARYSIGFPVQNQIANEPLTWRYENAGFASLVLPDATTLNNLPATQSKTSVAFYQTAQSKSFDCEPAKTIWIKFDLYHQGGSAFRIYSTSNGKTGIYRSSNTRIQLYNNGSAVLNIDNVLQTNVLQTWLLRMTADANHGAIELWCDGVKCGEFFGNVNNGVNFGNIYLQSAGANNLFSNVIVSNGEISFSEDVPHDVFNVEKNYDVEFNARNYDENFCIAYYGHSTNSRSKIPAGVFNNSTEFTIEIKFATNNRTGGNASEYENIPAIMGSNSGFSTGAGPNFRMEVGKLTYWQTGTTNGTAIVRTNRFVADNNAHKIIARSNADTSLDIFIDGELVSHVDDYGAKLVREYWGNYFASSGALNTGLKMNLFEARIWDKALADDEIFADIDGTEENLRAWYLPTPDGLKDFSANTFHPTNVGNYFAEYQRLLNDVECKIDNDALIWRYEDSIIYKGTGLPITFHLPATYDLWARFDVTFDGVNYWYAFSGEVDDMTGAVAASTTDIDYLADNVAVQTLANVLQKHRDQSFLLHLLSGIDDGKIELWIANVKQVIFTGNVNGGEPFTDFNLLCSGGTFFSNIIIANVSLEPEEKLSRAVTQFTAYNTSTHYFYLNKGGSYPNSITYSVKNSVRHITEIDVEHINEIWAKFDATSDGVNRWWFYNDDGFGQNGITAQIDGSADFIADDETVQTQTDAITLNQTQSYIVHMISDAENGLIELRVKNGGTYTYTGNVNDGEAFDEIWLRSESRGVVFGNYILSTSPLDFDADIEIDVDGEPLTKIFFNVRHNGDVIKIPFVAAESKPAVVIRWLGDNWYNPPTSSGDIFLRLGSATLALSNEL